MTLSLTSRPIQWAYDFIENSYLAGPSELKKDLSYYYAMAPFSGPFYGPGNPILLFCGNSQLTFESPRTWLLRDGLIPLSLFFKETKPSAVEGRFLIPAHLFFLVPPAWRERVGFYEYRSRKVFSAAHPPKRVLLMGHTNDTMMDYEEYTGHLAHLKQVLEPFGELPVSMLMVPKRSDMWGGWEDDQILRFTHALFKAFPERVSFPNWTQLENELNYEDTLYVEFNNYSLIYESRPRFLFLSRGAFELPRPAVGPDFNEVARLPASLHHELVVYEGRPELFERYRDPNTDLAYVELRKAFVAAGKGRKIQHWWEAWFGRYLKTYYSAEVASVLGHKQRD